MHIRVHGGTPGMIKKKENLKRRYEIHQRAEERWESFALLRKMWDRSVYSSSSQPYDPLKWSNILLVTPYQGLGCQCGLEREFSIIIWRCLTCLKGWKYPILHKKNPTIIIEKLGKINSTLCYRNFKCISVPLRSPDPRVGKCAGAISRTYYCCFHFGRTVGHGGSEVSSALDKGHINFLTR